MTELLHSSVRKDSYPELETKDNTVLFGEHVLEGTWCVNGSSCSNKVCETNGCRIGFTGGVGSHVLNTLRHAGETAVPSPIESIH